MTKHCRLVLDAFEHYGGRATATEIFEYTRRRKFYLFGGTTASVYPVLYAHEGKYWVCVKDNDGQYRYYLVSQA